MSESSWKKARQEIDGFYYVIDRQLRAKMRTPWWVHAIGYFAPDWKRKRLHKQEKEHRRNVRREMKRRSHEWKAWKEAHR